MSIHAWVVFPEEVCIPKIGEKISFSEAEADVMTTFHSNPDAAIEEAKGIGERTVICKVEVDDVTCIEALTAANYGYALYFNALIKDYFDYPCVND